MNAPQVFLLLVAALALGSATQPFYDCKHFAKIFTEQRNYRIFLPASYDTGNMRYPVIYYFHGHSDRYTLENPRKV